MGTDAHVVAPPAPTIASEASRKPAAPALTRRASLTAVAALLDYFVKAGVSLVVTPILVGGLGRTLFGIWEMLGRIVGYMAATDGRSTEALRLVIAQQQDADAATRQRSVGAAMAVFLLMVPLVALVGGTLAWFSPQITHAPPEQYANVRIAAAFLVASFLFTGLSAIPESVLRGMNLGYKRMGFQASLSILAGGLAALAVYQGWGLPGIGASQIVRALIIGVCYWWLVRKYVSWFSVARPARANVKSLLSMSVWLSVGDLVSKLLLASDVIILGAVISPAAVTTYVLTGYAARTGLGIFVFTAGSAMAGFGGVLGQGHVERAVKLRSELLTMTWLFATVVGATILAWNQSFLNLWVGAHNYAGPWVDLLIVLVVSQTAFIRTDAYIIDAALRPRGRVVIGAITMVATLALGITLTHFFGILGLCAGMLIGRAIQSVAYPLIVRACLKHPKRTAGEILAAIRLALVTAFLFAGANLVSRNCQAPSWPVWLLAVGMSVAVFGAVALVLGPTAEARRTLISRIRTILTGLRPARPKEAA
ncbi:MAG TPA: oligosaccharide flippase family protein [Gemmatimonadales bacterium]|nr:oligosaccharide flippase family protein [Gemmatimonadales bacterium]